MPSPDDSRPAKHFQKHPRPGEVRDFRCNHLPTGTSLRGSQRNSVAKARGCRTTTNDGKRLPEQGIRGGKHGAAAVTWPANVLWRQRVLAF